MKHLGDITKIDGGTAPVVEVVIGGSPCQNLSVAGRREGLSGARSGLFMEQIRIIREMRACQGILRRAEKRGKELPKLLKDALIQQSAFKREPDVTGEVKESSYSTTEQEHFRPSTTSMCFRLTAL